MSSLVLSRRAFSATSVIAALGAAGAARADSSPDSLGVSTSNAAIHQEVVFKASASRVYHALTDPKQFDKVVEFSGALQAMKLKASPCRIGARPGAAFSLFGGFITGRQIELSPGVRIVQSWRSAGWPPHIHSIARFELADQADGAKLVFDHTGFPNSEADSLAAGWQAHYWAPLAKVLA